MGHVESKTSSLGQILEKPCVPSRGFFLVQIIIKPCVCFEGHFFDLILMKLSQNVCLDDNSDEFENRSCRVKT